jgi:hypothetical protein
VQDPTSAGISDKLQGPIGFPVSPRKFWLMSILTFSLYLVYWGYQNFRHLNISVNTKFWSTVSALFLPLSLFALIKGLQKTATECGASIKLNPIKLALSFFVLAAIGKILDYNDFPIGGKFVALLSLVPLFQVQRKINAINAELRPSLQPDNKFSSWDLAGILAVASFCALRIWLPHYH